MLPALFVVFAMTASADENATCATEAATAAYKEGFQAQRARDAENALAAYARCIELDADCVPCHYENGWSHWTRSEWAQVVSSWKRALELDPDHRAVLKWMPQAQRNASFAPTKRSATGLRVPLEIESSPADAPITLELVARFQNYDPRTSAPDHYDRDIYSPKSARFTSDEDKPRFSVGCGARFPHYELS